MDSITSAEKIVYELSVEMVNALGLSQSDNPPANDADVDQHCKSLSSQVIEACKNLDDIIDTLPDEGRDSGAIKEARTQAMEENATVTKEMEKELVEADELFDNMTRIHQLMADIELERRVREQNS